ncbi:MAG: phosphate signaling complex protein PhoU [Legionellales bacterium]|jgi:phosphate transport system protein|nr:phosphate signaling complex protein PhoU [Legionellales bacterium]MBT5828119.1 phosphate signaling complex protein PhoU [Alphaproteobacteria bacterium]
MKNNEHIVKSYGNEIDDLVESLKAMKEMVIEIVKMAEDVVTFSAKVSYDEAQKKDQQINGLEKAIEARAITLLATRQPMAGDLRFIVSAIKIVSLLERIGDRAKMTIKKAATNVTPFTEEVNKDIRSMNKVIINMINEVFINIEKYHFSDLRKAFEDDNKVDDYYSETMKLVIGAQESKPENLQEFIAKIKILKNFERIGDYATKIAKIVYYIAEGSNSPNF